MRQPLGLNPASSAISLLACPMQATSMGTGLPTGTDRPRNPSIFHPGRTLRYSDSVWPFDLSDHLLRLCARGIEFCANQAQLPPRMRRPHNLPPSPGTAIVEAAWKVQGRQTAAGLPPLLSWPWYPISQNRDLGHPAVRYPTLTATTRTRRGWGARNSLLPSPRTYSRATGCRPRGGTAPRSP
jgi:hypothetical protein